MSAIRTPLQQSQREVQQDGATPETSGVRDGALRLGRWMLRQGAHEFTQNDLAASSIVFSPHYDDETLGCGGTIIRKRACGAEVSIVFMTDGSKSHSTWIDDSVLCGLRSAEGRAAAAQLGIDGRDVMELCFEETRLCKHRRAGIDAVAGILRNRNPQQVFVPHEMDPPADHVATRDIVVSALELSGLRSTVFEYPIWAWHRWPWTPADGASRGVRGIVRDFVLGNARFMQSLCRTVFVGDVLENKRAALREHRTQMSRYNGDSSWPVLADVANGAFLACFFEQYEYFGLAPRLRHA